MSTATPMQAAVKRYLEDRRRLGFVLTAPATELARFARYADSREHRGPLTQELMLGWALEHVHRTSDVTAARRLETLLPFAAYCRQFEPGTQIPPRGILGRSHRRLAPHIYTDQEILQLLDAASKLTLTWPLRALSYRNLFGLIAATGLRLSEALKLTLSDVDLRAAAITVRQTKFHKSRCLPLHPSTVRELELYRQARDRCQSTEDSAPFFVSHDGRRLPTRTVENVFRRLVLGLGRRARGDHPHPRIHDLRHTMVVRRLQRWRESGQAVAAGVGALFGHALVPGIGGLLLGGFAGRVIRSLVVDSSKKKPRVPSDALDGVAFGACRLMARGQAWEGPWLRVTSVT